jgi:hypothetical protein
MTEPVGWTIFDQRNPALIVSDKPGLDDRLRKGSQRRDHHWRQHRGTDADGKARDDITAFEYVFEKGHSPLLSLATIR